MADTFRKYYVRNGQYIVYRRKHFKNRC